MLVFEERAVFLHPDTFLWRCMFFKEKVLLKLLLGNSIIDIQHIGSTAIRGVPAKPIIDILLGVISYETGAQLVPLIKELGYEYRGENREIGQYYFIKGNPHKYYLYVNEIGSQNWEDKIRFRDYLREDVDMAKAYAELKLSLCKQPGIDMQAYQAGKKPFVNNVLQKEEKGDA